MKLRTFLLSAAAMVLLAVGVQAQNTQQTREVFWGKQTTPAVVNPVVRSELSDYISLDGTWDFCNSNAWWGYLRSEGTVWGGGNYFDWENNSRPIEVPGIWEVQGVGEPGPNRSWNSQWDRSFWNIRHVWDGVAAYRKMVTLPESWKGKHIWLKIGAVRSEAYIWVNRRPACYINNCCATEKADIASLLDFDGPNEILALVRNDSPSRKGFFSCNHCFGGFYRSIELEATGEVYIDDVWARGEIDGPTAELRVTVAAADEKPFQGTLESVLYDRQGNSVGKAETQVSAAGQYVLTIPVKNGTLWTPENPYLYVAKTVLRDADGKALHGWDERFGIRKLEVRGDRFFLNGKPYFFRGVGDHNGDQMTLIEMPDRQRFLEHMKTMKTAGFNFCRHHTHIPLPEYFEAADEAGLLLEPELPYYTNIPTESFPFDPMRDLKELFRNFRRYTSFAVYSCGNEGWFMHPTDEILYRWAKQNDPDRLFIHQDGGRNMPGNSDYSTGGADVPECNGGLINPWPRGKFDYLNRPFVAHEYLNLAIKMDSHLEDRFTGIRVSPVSLEAWRNDLAACSLTEQWGCATLRAAEKLQGYYQKAGLESARSDPQCDGYSFWSLTDVSIPVNQNTTAAQGYLNAFWEPRPNGIAPERFFRFNGPSTILADFDRPRKIFTAGEQTQVSLLLSHFGWKDLPAGTIAWKITANGKDNTGKELAGGRIDFAGAQTGKTGSIGQLTLTLPEVSAPTPAVFELSIEGSDIANDWECWIFPVRSKKSLAGFVVDEPLYDFFASHYTDVKKYDAGTAGGAVLIARGDSPAAREAIERGEDLFAIAEASPNPNVSLGWWELGTQVGTAFDEGPIWGDFPTAAWMNELWFGLIRYGAPDLRTPGPFGVMTPLAVGEGRDSYYLYLGRTKTEKNGTILASFALDLTQDTPEALSLLDNLLESFK